MQTVFLIKLILMLIFFLQVTIFGNFISRLKCFKNKSIMSLAMTFSGSLFLSIALVDIIPEAIYHFNQFLQQPIASNQSKVPLTMMIAMTMFVFIMWIDKIAIGHSHSHEQYQIQFEEQPKKSNGENHQFQEQHPGTQHKHEQKKLENNVQADNTKGVNWKPYILQAGMSIHAFFQTLAVGLQSSTMSVLSLSAAILVHKWAQGLTLGLLYKKQGFNGKTITIMIIVQGLVNILGLLTGSFLMGQGTFVMAFFMSLSAGTFLYISLVQVLQQQMKSFNKSKMIMVVLANLFICLIVWLQKVQESKVEGQRMK